MNTGNRGHWRRHPIFVVDDYSYRLLRSLYWTLGLLAAFALGTALLFM